MGDPSSRLRTGEMGSFLASAVVERDVATVSSSMAVGSMASAYTAPPMDGAEATKPGKAKQAWQATGAGPGAGATMSTQAPDSGTMQITGLGSSTWGASRMDARLGARMADSRVDPNSAVAADQLFRTTCPKAEDDQTHEKWALPYETQPLYAYFDSARQEAAKKTRNDALKTFPNKQKFSTHAQFETFKLTRHPTGGTERLKGFKFGQSAMGAAQSWLESAEARLQDPVTKSLAKELLEAKEDMGDDATPADKKRRMAVNLDTKGDD